MQQDFPGCSGDLKMLIETIKEDTETVFSKKTSSLLSEMFHTNLQLTISVISFPLRGTGNRLGSRLVFDK